MVHKLAQNGPQVAQLVTEQTEAEMLSRIVNGRAVATNTHKVMVTWTCSHIPTNMAHFTEIHVEYTGALRHDHEE